jgi:AraC-like DNA-binding protein/ElaB/YqjD/DUF883 family membrane-anchored ribosome-binding protein
MRDLFENQPEPALKTATLEKIQVYVGELAVVNLTLPQLAAKACMSRFHFARLFRRSTGLSPHQYIVSQRIDRAKEMLCCSREPIAEIAMVVGFVDQSHLTRHFKRIIGATPARFRRFLRSGPFAHLAQTSKNAPQRSCSVCKDRYCLEIAAQSKRSDCRASTGATMNQKIEHFCDELRTKINDVDKRLKDLKANAKNAGQKAKDEAKAHLEWLENKAKEQRGRVVRSESKSVGSTEEDRHQWQDRRVEG